MPQVPRVFSKHKISDMGKRIAFLKIHSHSVNTGIVRALTSGFPGAKIDVIDVGQLVRRRRARVLINLLFVFKEYGWEIIRGRKKVREAFWRTPYIFRTIKALAAGVLSRDKYVFSFQNQSLFDASKEGLPHYVYTDHTHLANLRYPDFDRGNLYSRRWIALEHNVYRNATFNFTRNTLTTDSIVRDYGCPERKVLCVYAGSNIDTDVEIDATKYASKNILFVGLEWERKGGPELVEAFRRVLQVHPDARLTVVGCCPELDVPNCEVIGRVPLREVAHQYERACLLCLPSHLEPYAIVQLEAFSHALPVVTTDIGGQHDYVVDGKNGYLVKLGDVKRLSEVLVELLSSPERCRTLGENGRLLVLERFTWDKVGAAIARSITVTLKDDSG